MVTRCTHKHSMVAQLCFELNAMSQISRKMSHFAYFIVDIVYA
ncbi:hypothetical protein VVMO6_01120 [Vibrio vulnificus MO6-24/O]|nr:hypothetical protein VVMO6_01120 [Vibrio vulnificus MO6-24/O]